MDEASVRIVFRQLYLAELELGTQRSLDDYRGLFPGFESTVDEQHRRLSLGTESDPAVAFAAPKKIHDAQHLGRYRLEREIGRGGQAVVWLAEDEELKRRVAVKILTRPSAVSERQLLRFKREAEVCSKLDHPGICSIYGTGIENDTPYIAMQFIEGNTLSTLIAHSKASTFAENETVSVEEIEPESATNTSPPAVIDADAVTRYVRIVEKAARALHVAHEEGIIHRDVKPGNIIVKEDDQPVLLDFGLAHHEDDAYLTLTNTGEFFGTPSYMSPEQISAHRIGLDRRTDVFSLGVTLYECVSGDRPFDGGTQAATYQAIMAKEPSDPRRINPAISKDLWAVIHKAIEKDRDRRYASAAAFADDLANILALRPVGARPAGPILRAIRWSQRNRLVAAMGGVTLFVILLAFGWAAYGRHQKRNEEKAREESVERTRLDAVATFDRLFQELSRDVYEAFKRPGALSNLMSAVNSLGEEGVDLVLEKSRADVEAQRILAAQLLVSLSRPDTIERLRIMAEKDESVAVASWASQGLMRMDSIEVIPALESALEHSPHEAVRVNAMWGLCKFSHPGGIEATRKFLENPTTNKRFFEAMGQGLLLLEVESAIPLVDLYVFDLINDEVRSKQPYFDSMMEMAVKFYGQFQNGAGAQSLDRLANEPKVGESERKSALEALVRIERNAGVSER